MDAKTANRHEWRERYQVLRGIEDWLELPMFVLSLVWAALLVIELAWGTGPRQENLATLIWIIFIAEFLLKFVIAPRKLSFLRKRWLTVFALALPALRVFRASRVVYMLRFGRAVRGITMARLLTAFNRGLQSLRKTIGRFGFGYILTMTLLVTILGAAGMQAFERDAGGGLTTFGDALWFTGMMMTTTGSEYWPITPEGRILCFLLALYAFAIFGYVTATIATLLVGQEAKSQRVAPVDAAALQKLRAEIARLSDQLASREVLS